VPLRCDTRAKTEGQGWSTSHPDCAYPRTRNKCPDANGNVIDSERGAAQAFGRNVGDCGSEQSLRYAQLQALEGRTQRRQPDCARIGQYHIGANQDDGAESELKAAIEMVCENTERIAMSDTLLRADGVMTPAFEKPSRPPVTGGDGVNKLRGAIVVARVEPDHGTLPPNV